MHGTFANRALVLMSVLGLLLASLTACREQGGAVEEAAHDITGDPDAMGDLNTDVDGPEVAAPSGCVPDIALGGYQACAVDCVGELRCWGQVCDGTLPEPYCAVYSRATTIIPGVEWRAVDVGDEVGCERGRHRGVRPTRRRDFLHRPRVASTHGGERSLERGGCAPAR